MDRNFRLLGVFAVSLVATTGANAATCTQTLSPGADLASAIANAPANGVICLNTGDYGTVNLYDIARSSFVTVQSVTGKGAVITPQVGNSTYIRLSNLTISGALQNNCSRNIAWVSNTVTQQITLSNSGCSGSLQTTFDGNTFGAIDAGDGYEGRLSLIYGSGITVTNNTFGPAGASDGIFMGGNVSNVTIGPNNTFTGIQESLCGSVHCDAIQGYGAGSGIEIKNNLFQKGDTYIMMPDGSSGVNVHDNVFDGSGMDYLDKIQFGSASNPVFLHNTLVNVRADFDSKTGSSATSKALVQNNIMAAGSSFKTSGGAGCASCTFSSNMFNSAGSASGSGNLIATPVFVGGGVPAVYSGFALAPGSPGKSAGNDGADMGGRIAGVLLNPPTNVAVH